MEVRSTLSILEATDQCGAWRRFWVIAVRLRESEEVIHLPSRTRLEAAADVTDMRRGFDYNPVREV